MKVTININRDDYWNTVWYAAKKMSMVRIVVVVLVLFLVCLFTSQQLSFGLALPFALGIGIVAAAFSITLPILLAKFAIKRIPSEGQGILGEHSVTITDTGFNESTAVNESTFSWSAVEKIACNGDYIFLLINGGLAFALPRRDFESDEAFYEFLDRATAFLLNARANDE